MEANKKRAFYTWQGIKRRCYNPKDKEYRSYGAKGVTICDEWMDFEKFAEWYLSNYYEVEGEYMAIDKDLLSGEKKIYSPETCIFLPYRLNGMMVHKDNGNMRGLQKRGEKYEVKVKNPTTGKNEYCGRYDSVEVAQAVYKQCKTAIFRGVVEEYRDKLPEHVFDVLIKHSF